MIHLSLAVINYCCGSIKMGSNLLLLGCCRFLRWTLVGFDVQLTLLDINCCAQRKNLWWYDSTCKWKTNLWSSY